MPVPSDMWNRVVTAPARSRFITSLIQNEKTLLCCFTITFMGRRNERDFVFECRDKLASAAGQ